MMFTAPANPPAPKLPTRRRMAASSVAATLGLVTVILMAGLGGPPLVSAEGASAPPPVGLDFLPGGSGSYATSVNDNGQVVGNSDTGGGFQRAFSWTQAGGMVDVGTLADSGNSFGYAVSNNGQVILAAGFPEHVFSWTQADGMVDLGTLGGSTSIITGGRQAVNDVGQVVGASYLADPAATHAFSWTQAAGMVDLGTLGGTFSAAEAVNAGGQVVGRSMMADGVAHAFSWTQAAGMVDLGTFGGDTSSEAIAVNASGQAVGLSSNTGPVPSTTPAPPATTGPPPSGPPTPTGPPTAASTTATPTGPVTTSAPTSIPPPPSGPTSRPVLWTAAGVVVDLGTLGGSYGNANALNDAGQVVGASSTPPDGDTHAFSWTQTGGMVDLGTLGGTSSEALAVNDAGVVVGHSLTADNAEQHAFSWTQAGGMVDLGTLGNGEARAIAKCRSVGTDAGRATMWQPVPTGVVAGAGDASASVSWTPPADLGCGPVTSYTVSASPGPATTTVSGSATSATVSGLTNSTGHTFTVTASYASGTATATSAPSTSVTPTAGSLTPSTVSGPVAAGGSISTGANPNALAPVSTTVTTPTGGDITIATTSPTDPAPSGFLFGNQQVNITVDGPTPPASDPLRLLFTIYPQAGQTPGNTTIYRTEGDGSPELVMPCDPSSLGQAVPDPCATLSWDATSPNPNVVAEIFTTSASEWNVATPEPAGVEVTDSGYSPAQATASLGGSLRWTFTGSRLHSVTEAVGLGDAGSPLFDSGSRSTGSYRPTQPFLAAGEYAYKSTVQKDKSKGSVLVPVVFTRASPTAPYLVTWATGGLPGHVFNVQYRFKAVGAKKWTDWVSWQSRVTVPKASFEPARGAGTYGFRAALRNTGTGRSSGWSPEVTITDP